MPAPVLVQWASVVECESKLCALPTEISTAVVLLMTPVVDTIQLRPGVSEIKFERVDVGAVRPAADAVRQRVRVGVEHVPRGHPPVVRQLVVPPNQRLVQRRLGRRLALVVVAHLAGHVRVRPEAQRGQRRRVEAARVNPPEDALVLETPRGVRRAAGQPGRVVLDVGVRIPVGVNALREVALPLERGRHRHPRLAHGVLPALELLAEEEEQLVVAARLANRPADGEARLRCASSTAIGVFDRLLNQVFSFHPERRAYQ